jgi:hypothetical protein
MDWVPVGMRISRSCSSLPARLRSQHCPGHPLPRVEHLPDVKTVSSKCYLEGHQSFMILLLYGYEGLIVAQRISASVLIEFQK